LTPFDEIKLRLRHLSHV